MSGKAFSDLTEQEIPAYLRAARTDLAIAPEHRPAVLENLRGLLRHAQIVAAALASQPSGADDEPAAAFEP